MSWGITSSYFDLPCYVLVKVKQSNIISFYGSPSNGLLASKRILNLFSFFFLFTVCSIHALGMESKALPNSAITASSFWTKHPGHDPWLARLNNVPERGSTGSWSAKFNKTGEWLQVDLGEERLLTNLSTQGRPSMDQWVKSYNISFSSDSVKWESYKENNAVKVCDRDFLS